MFNMMPIRKRPGAYTKRGKKSHPWQSGNETVEHFTMRYSRWLGGTFLSSKPALSGAERFRLQKALHKQREDEAKQRRLDVLEIRRNEKLESIRLKAAKKAAKEAQAEQTA